MGMEKYLKHIEETWDQILRMKLTANPGQYIILWEDGDIALWDGGSRPITYREYITIRVPGDLDRTEFLAGWATRREDGVYIENETGREMDWEEVVEVFLEGGTVCGWIADLIHEVEEEEGQ